MTHIARIPGDLTADQFLETDQRAFGDAWRYELVDGVVVTQSAPSPRHAAILAGLVSALANRLKGGPNGCIPETGSGAVPMRAQRNTARIPDARAALCVVRLAMMSASFAALAGCGIYGDWSTNVLENRSGETVVAIPLKGKHAGEEHLVPSGRGLTVPYGGFGYDLTISTTSNPRSVIFRGHLCSDQSVLVVNPTLTISCVREIQLIGLGHTGI